MLIDSWYDPYLGVVVLVRVVDGESEEGQRDQADVDRRRPTRVERVGIFRPKQEMLDEAWARRGRLLHRRHQGSRRYARRRYRHRREAPGRASPAGLQAGAAGGVLPDFSPSTRRTSKTLREAMAKLRLNDASFSYEMETIGRAGLRLPLRFSRACSISKSSASGSSANSISISSPPRRA